MKKNKANGLFMIGMLFTILGLTIFTESKYLRYISLSLGVILTIYSVIKENRERKKSKNS